MRDDERLIDALGGTASLANRLGMTPQRVCNWRRRGIPARIKNEFPNMFLNHGEWDIKRRRKKPEA